ncbi:MAG: hydrogenase expression/formation protein HupK [Pseudomonadota bacterium]
MLDGRGKTKDITGLRPVRAPALPVETMVLGKPVTEAADLVPRLFNLCRAAQALAVRKALGLPVAASMNDELRHEIMRDHLLKLCVALPAQFGIGSEGLPSGWASDRGAAARAVFGPTGEPPKTPDDLDAFLTSGHRVAEVLHKIDQCFDPGEAATGQLTSLSRTSTRRDAPVENSVAGRHGLHPVMRHIAETRGRGPLWRTAARLYDVAACLNDRLPAAISHTAGNAIVPATRGTYIVTANSQAGHVTQFARVTPTDHMLAPDGILDRTLATLPAMKEGLATLILEILDPCTPVRLKEAGDA